MKLYIVRNVGPDGILRSVFEDKMEAHRFAELQKEYWDELSRTNLVPQRHIDVLAYKPCTED